MRGFTLLEILFALGIILVITALAVAAFSSFRQNSLLKEARAKVLSELSLARIQTLGAEGKSSWGVHFEETRLVRFKGSSYSASDPSNLEILLPAGAKIGLISLGGASEVIFERLTGRAASIGTIRIELTSDALASTTITIYASGLAE
ncbi:hypothetical protein A3B26_01625 [Candidatus Giovannonibacteria bacterium RIFCSPLOWO2_01_FULL_48_47]|nr:MAG: hypothetical protein A3D61_02955 [Candidatus Giovannonibacteria bacterium RIFCSPHIGHO2_02_FULL_48_15]OGF88408.1 MAG: hypothetical protein A3B26_01625 [Candidatus Giovannonibacteria bacterium RIFCSPLOWO2_01_FULL_48_47]OGF96275.1 MAG: hypothetical protein A2613_01785 [Candidatus Giovannonibacteria bacterium RIFOXYD1_FULL_48_21]HBT81814.1 hypothetical protein [Candidatus Giovannonibacteria bacterium]